MAAPGSGFIAGGVCRLTPALSILPSSAAVELSAVSDRGGTVGQGLYPLVGPGVRIYCSGTPAGVCILSMIIGYVLVYCPSRNIILMGSQGILHSVIFFP